MAEILQTENPFLPGQPISDDINIYLDDVNDRFIVKDKSTDEIVFETPSIYPPQD